MASCFELLSLDDDDGGDLTGDLAGDGDEEEGYCKSLMSTEARLDKHVGLLWEYET